ncbi:MAG TPA: response regulator transcription factor [Puia sp.]|jgi:DNA-binding NarL/FixJ family response regulator|nr:response regulator transcription factor [Puia sp.]
MIGILVYEDNDSLRESLANLLMLSKDLLLLGSFPRADDISAHIARYNPEVILMDIEMPGLNGIEAVRQVRTLDKKVNIIILTVFDDNKHVLDAICAGASGYLLKKHLSDHLPEAIRQVMDGEPPMSRGIARMIIAGMQQTATGPTPNDYKLSAREKEILSHLSKGEGLKAMASELNISLDTVRTHIKNIYEKLQVHTQTEAVSKAINEKLV